MARDDALDPDALAALEEERDFLLASLRDLDREYEAGDVDEDDYRTLRDDYTHRAASTLRAIEQRRAARTDAVTPRRPGRTVAGIAGVVVFALLAGFGVAKAAGDRTSSDGLTGDVRATVGQMLFRCDELRAQTQIRDALECYDDVLEQHPANAEAMTSKGWTLAISGLPDLGWPYFEDALLVDPGYSDLRAFRAIVLNWWCRPEETLAELDAFDDSDPLAEMETLIEGRGLRQQAEELLEVRRGVDEVADAPVPVTESDPDEWDQCPVLADAGVIERAEPPE
ncbi:MAG: hypothetical protein ACLFRV_06215 [Acidimicrobiales bacterium]